MLKIRLQRVGRVHEPSFRLVLTDSLNSTKSGRFKEILGSYDPRKSKDSLNTERIQYWLSKGASPTATVNNLLVRHRIINASKIDVSAVSKKAPVPEEKPATPATNDSQPTTETQSEKDTGSAITPTIEETKEDATIEVIEEKVG